MTLRGKGRLTERGLVCDYCGKGFARKPYRIKPGPVYCSQQCCGKAKKGKARPLIDEDGRLVEDA